MKFICRLIVLSVICGGAFSFGVAQTQATAQSAGRTDENLPGIETKFDSAKNETTVGFQRQMVISGTATDQIRINVEATYATPTPTQHPDAVMFAIISVNPTDYRYPNQMELNITADGKRLSPVLLGPSFKSARRGIYIEVLAARMPYDVFMQLATAKAVDLKFIQTSLTLNDKQLAKLREFADHLHL